MKNRQEVISILGVIALAVGLPIILKAANSLMRSGVTAEGRLAAINVETDRSLGPMPKPWLALAQGGQNQETFLVTNASAVAQLKPEYIRIDHIFDGFGVVGRDQQGGLTFDWSRLDAVVGEMTNMGAKPFLVLSYMPPVLATTDEVSEPRNWNDWSEVVQKTIEHYSGSLGIDGVYYEVWNEPNWFGNWTMGGTKDYRNLYAYAAAGAQAAKNTKPFKIGGPATTGLYKNWLDGFLDWALANKVRMDFYSWHRYDLDMSQYQADIQQIEAYKQTHPNYAGLETLITETGANSKAGGDNDNDIGAAQAVAVERAMMAKVNYAFNFAVAGDWGLVGKPRYTALAFLTALGDERLPVTGEGSWVEAVAARKGETDQVVVTNYDPKNQHSETVPMTFMNLQNQNFTLKTTTLEGVSTTTKVATTAAVLQTQIPMPPNEVVLVELTPGS